MTSYFEQFLSRLNPADLALIKQYHFDQTAFLTLQKKLQQGAFTLEHNRTSHTVTVPKAAQMLSLTANTEQEQDWELLGKQAIENGEIGVVILNGGMATRFGGVAKGTVEVLPKKSFLQIKLNDLCQTAASANHSVHIPCFLLNSFATDKISREHLQAYTSTQKPLSITHCTQNISFRLSPYGDIYTDKMGSPSLFAPGHGDLFDAISRSSNFEQFCAAGGKALLVSNVDNLGATLDPKVVGAHLSHNNPVTVEVTDRFEGDTGGAPVNLNGRLQLLEGMRFPDDFPIEDIPVFNTNTMMVDVDVFKSHPDLPWVRADKKVNGDTVVQFERLMGEITHLMDATFLQVPRNGDKSRFLPVKSRDDLAALRPYFAKRFGD